MPVSGPRPLQIALASVLAGSILLVFSTPLEAKTLRAGPFTFSDERGGFEIISASGKGTEKDPVVLIERIFGTEPVTLVITADASEADDGTVHIAGMFAFAMVKIVINDTPTSWTGFSLELQEIAGRPSGYFDGLSFDQVTQFRDRLATSDRFAEIAVEQEPRDRINFHAGSVTRHDRVELVFNITDMTPKSEFYLVQDPEVATAALPPARWSYKQRRADVMRSVRSARFRPSTSVPRRSGS